MKNKNTNPETYFERLRELAAVNKQVVKESKSSSTLLEYKKAGDGRLYGIVKENHAYFIKTAQSKNAVSEADFAYIGGLSNVTEYKCQSLTEAQKVLNTKVMTVNETYGMMEDEQEDEMPQPEPQPEAAPAPEGEPMPEPMPEPQAEPAPAPEGEPMPEPQPEEGKDELHSAISTAAQEFSDATNLESSKVEYYLKQFLGVIQDSQLAKLDDQQKQAIYDQYFNGQNVEESDEFLTESDIFEDAELKDDEFEGDDELDLDVPEMEDEIQVAGGIKPSGNGGKEVNIDLNTGTVNVKLSEGKIKQLAKKYNVSESYIKWKANDILKEEVEKAEKEKLKEERVRKVVRNIIKEKLGLKKKSLTESVSKEREKLEKLVESVLKKNI